MKFDYKDAPFYTEYFRNLKGFKVIEDFKPSEDKEEKNLYVGSVEVLDTIYPLVLRVEIPFSFPHNKLIFRTKSLSGYPHLIHTGKIEYGDWFCLNTPFAETPKEQLEQEVSRLKEWIAHQMRNDLPPVIKDFKTKHALALANAYDWENPDEVKEFSSQAMLTFIGDFHSKSDYFKESMGYLNCIKTKDDRFYALENSTLTNYKLPYIIVDQAPKSMEVLSDFVQLREQYGWDAKTCEHLLPGLHLTDSWNISDILFLGTIKGKPDWEEAEALEQIEALKAELSKEESYLPAKILRVGGNNESMKPMKVLPGQKPVILAEIKGIKESVIKRHKYSNHAFNSNLSDFVNMTDEERFIYEGQERYHFEIELYELHHFAFGIKCDDGIGWYILFTSKHSVQYESVRFDLSLRTLDLSKPISCRLGRLGVQVITEELYFGRGSLSNKLKSKKIALVGLGAIGSMLAETLAHSGVSKIGLWDPDIVEPGNVCRSSYTIRNIGESKVYAIASIIKSINPFIETVNVHGYWITHNVNDTEFVGTSFYDNVNYKNQDEAIQEIQGYDLIIDCTGSNEMLHFLSYAASGTDIVSMCITNHANNLLCITSKDGNPFELRKTYLSRIEQDTKNFYVEGSGCYSPTFLAKNCDIASLVNLAIRDLNGCMEDGLLMHSTVYSYADRGIVADRLSTYKLAGYDIRLTVPSETLYDAEEIEDSPDGDLGYVFGSYSKDGRLIMMTHIVDSFDAKELLGDAYKTSKGLIDYIGDYRYSGEQPATYTQSSLEVVAYKAESETVNTNNPLLAVRNPDGSVSFFLYINNELVLFVPEG